MPDQSIADLAELTGAPVENLTMLYERLKTAAISDIEMPPAIVAGILFSLAQSMLDNIDSAVLKRASLLACVKNAQAQLEAMGMDGYVVPE